MKKILGLTILFFSSLGLYAQSFSVSGTVTSQEDGLPLPGVNVLVEGTNNGAVTDFDGNYTLNDVGAGQVLSISFLGFKTQKVTVNSQRTINVSLEEDSQSLDEVIVIGYGSQVKRQVTGAVSTVSDETIANLEPLNAAQALQGTTSGVNVTPQGGAPGASANIRIRGVATNGDNRPLIILDGFQYDGDLNSLNPSDIENMTVLKDAQAAIYGAIGSS